MYTCTHIHTLHYANYIAYTQNLHLYIRTHNLHRLPRYTHDLSPNPHKPTSIQTSIDTYTCKHAMQTLSMKADCRWLVCPGGLLRKDLTEAKPQSLDQLDGRLKNIDKYIKYIHHTLDTIHANPIQTYPYHPYLHPHPRTLAGNSRSTVVTKRITSRESP